MIDQGTLSRLMAVGRAKGGLTNEDLRAALPVETMSADDIALVVVHLEDAGIPVELDESLLTPHGTRAPADVRPVEILSPEKASTAAPAPGARARSDAVMAAAPGPAKPGSPPPVSRSGWRSAWGLAAVALMILALVLLLR